jgi:serine/threonine protein kinase
MGGRSTHSSKGNTLSSPPNGDTDAVLSVIGEHYTVERELGAGGMARVYLCTDKRTGERAAVKVLRQEIGSPVVIERFLREIAFSSELDHPRIPKVLDSGTVGDMPFYAMSYIEGESLRSRLVREKQLPIPAAINIICEVIDATSYAHGHGIVHRDIKPENIIVAKDGVHVLDFGIARAIVESGMDRLTSTGVGIGTPAYMSPEQALGDRTLDVRSDVYSIGCVLYEMIAGIPPFVGPTAQVIISRRFAAPPPPLSEVREGVADWIESAVARALMRAPADRWESAAEFSAALSAGPTGARVVAKADERSRKRKSRRIAAIGLAAVLTIAIVAGAWRVWGDRITGTDSGNKELRFEPKRIAVLYFKDLTPTHQLGYLADGLTESVIDQLQAVPSLEVIAKNSVQHIRQNNIAPDSAARLLKAGSLLGGTVQAIGDRVGVRITLTDGNTGRELERASFDHPAGDPLSLREELVKDVADFLRQRIGEQIQLQEWKTGTRNQDAWVLAQRAERALKDAEGLSSAGDTAGARETLHIADSLALLSQSRDRAWVQPVVMRGTVAFRQSRISSSPTEMKKWTDEALKSAEDAVARDPRNPAALELRGTLHYWQWLNDLIPDPKESAAALRLAEEDLRKAVLIDAHRAGAWSVLSSLATNTGNPSDAAYSARRAYEEDAYLSAAGDIVWRLYNTAYDNENPIEAAKWCDEGRRRFPSNPRFVQCQLWLLTMRGAKPNIAHAWKLVDTLRSVTPASEWAFSGREGAMLVAGALARAGQPDSARHVLERSRGNPEIDPSRDLVIDEAVVRTILGDKTEALRLLKDYLVANPDHRAGMATTQSWWWRDLKTDPRYIEMVGSS